MPHKNQDSTPCTHSTDEIIFLVLTFFLLLYLWRQQ